MLWKQGNILHTGRFPWLLLKRQLSVIFYGSDEFSLRSLQHLVTNKGVGLLISKLEVVCKGKDLPVKSFAKSQNLIIHEWPYSIPRGRYDVGVVVSFGYLIPKESIESCLYGMVNVHPSLLPRWRGAAPLQHTIINNDRETGVSIVDVAPDRFDVGKILIQERFAVPNRVTLIHLSEFLAEEGARLLMQVLSDLPGHRARSWVQGDQGATRAHKVTQKMARVKWSRLNAQQVDCLCRGLPFPLYTFWKERKVRLLQSLDPIEASSIPFQQILSQKGGGTIARVGSAVFDKKSKVLGVKTGDNWSAFKEVVIGRQMPAKDFHNGFISKVNPADSYFTEDGPEASS